jgi:hypothetical protein
MRYRIKRTIALRMLCLSLCMAAVVCGVAFVLLPPFQLLAVYAPPRSTMRLVLAALVLLALAAPLVVAQADGMYTAAEGGWVVALGIGSLGGESRGVVREYGFGPAR